MKHTLKRCKQSMPFLPVNEISPYHTQKNSHHSSESRLLPDYKRSQDGSKYRDKTDKWCNQRDLSRPKSLNKTDKCNKVYH